MPRSFYDVLGVQPTASDDEIRKAYKRAALRVHPDRQAQAGGASVDTGEEFKRVNEAYTVLSDHSKRRLYDQHGVWPPPDPMNVPVPAAHNSTTVPPPRRPAKRYTSPGEDGHPVFPPNPFGPDPFHASFETAFRSAGQPPLIFERFFANTPAGEAYLPSNFFPPPLGPTNPMFTFTSEPATFFDTMFSDFASGPVPHGHRSSGSDNDADRNRSRGRPKPRHSSTAPPTSEGFFYSESIHVGIPLNSAPEYMTPFAPHQPQRSDAGPQSAPIFIKRHHATAIVNGSREDVFTGVDVAGNQHIERRYGDGRRDEYFINGVKQLHALPRSSFDPSVGIPHDPISVPIDTDGDNKYERRRRHSSTRHDNTRSWTKSRERNRERNRDRVEDGVHPPPLDPTMMDVRPAPVAPIPAVAFAPPVSVPPQHYPSRMPSYGYAPPPYPVAPPPIPGPTPREREVPIHHRPDYPDISQRQRFVDGQAGESSRRKWWKM